MAQCVSDLPGNMPDLRRPSFDAGLAKVVVERVEQIRLTALQRVKERAQTLTAERHRLRRSGLKKTSLREDLCAGIHDWSCRMDAARLGYVKS
jgi:hypothetical protein